MANFFLTDTNGNKRGPYNEQQLQALAAKGVINPQTPMETDAGHKGLAGQIPGLFAATPPPQAVPVREIPLDATSTIWKINFYFQILCASICGLIASVSFTFFLSFSSKTSDTFFSFLIFLIGVIGIVGVIFELMLLYQLWKVIPEDIARTTPSRAVGLMCIFVFSLYWMFVALVGLSEDLNKTFRKRGSQHRVREAWGMVFCILFINSLYIYCFGFWVGADIAILFAGLLDFVGFFFLLAFFISVKNGAIELLEQGEA